MKTFLYVITSSLATLFYIAVSLVLLSIFVLGTIASAFDKTKGSVFNEVNITLGVIIIILVIGEKLLIFKPWYATIAFLLVTIVSITIAGSGSTTPIFAWVSLALSVFSALYAIKSASKRIVSTN